jgi:predicted metal-dependent phosphoesterase TrpH
MGYKIETHLHTPVISPCGVLTPQELVEGYLKAGFSAITVTEHFHADAFRHAGIDPAGEGTFQAFLEGYRQVCRAAEGTPLRVYYGAELRFRGCGNDYLLYGFPHELLAKPEEVWAMGIVRFSELAREAGALLIQAHPYRAYCLPVDPYLIDGVEGVNRHDVHANRNDLAVAYGRRYGLRITGGSDCHHPADVGRGGIEADWLPEDSMDLARLLRAGDYRILGDDSGLNAGPV